jgi:hypothetical protein
MGNCKYFVVLTLEILENKFNRYENLVPCEKKLCFPNILIKTVSISRYIEFDFGIKFSMQIIKNADFWKVNLELSYYTPICVRY